MSDLKNVTFAETISPERILLCTILDELRDLQQEVKRLVLSEKEQTK